MARSRQLPFADPEGSEEIAGTVERITFRNDENGYTVARFNIEPVGFTTITGRFTSINPGEHLTVTGKWIDHEKFGRQFEVSSYRVSVPATLSGMQKYLASGLIPGIGPVYAKKIIQHFGDQVFEIIGNEPDRVTEVPGIGKKKAQKIVEVFESQKAIRSLMIWLQEHEVSTTMAIKIYKVYGDDSIRVLKENPYTLAEDIFGIGFVTADTIARKLGMDPNDPKRHRAGILYILKEASGDGHMYLPRDKMLTDAEELLGASFNEVIAAIDYLIAFDQIVQDDDRIYLKQLFNYEKSIAERLARMSKGRSRKFDDAKAMELIEKI